MTTMPPTQADSQFVLYQTEDGKLKIDVRFEGETVWSGFNCQGILDSSTLS